MISKLRTFREIARDEGLVRALLATRHVAPSPASEHLAFTESFLDESAGHACARDAPSERERRHTVPGALRSRLDRWRTWRTGFTPRSRALYDFDEHAPDDYVSDRAREFCWELNSPHHTWLNDKLRFHAALEDEGFGPSLPEMFGTMSDGEGRVGGTDLLSLLERESTLVVKPRWGGGGRGVHVCEAAPDGIRVDGEKCTAADVRELVAGTDEAVVTGYCSQTDYAEELYPETPNTIRIVSMTPADGDPFVAGAVHRIGTASSRPVDNFSRGGLSAPVSEDGVLGPAVRYADGAVSTHTVHPDTGAPIEGVRVPLWDAVVDLARAVTASFPRLANVGWDVIVTDDGPTIVEGNANPDSDLLQAHEPLLCDDRVREVYREHGIVD